MKQSVKQSKAYSVPCSLAGLEHIFKTWIMPIEKRLHSFLDCLNAFLCETYCISRSLVICSSVFLCAFSKSSTQNHRLSELEGVLAAIHLV